MKSIEQGADGILYLQEPQRNRHNRAHRNWGILQARNMAASNMRTIPSYMGFINANPFGHHYYCSSFPPLAYCIIENHISGVSYCCGATAQSHSLLRLSRLKQLPQGLLFNAHANFYRMFCFLTRPSSSK